MEHLGTKTLETSRLTLRRLTMDDAPEVFRNWASDNEVAKYMMWPAHQSIDDTNAYLRTVVEAYPRADKYEWGIVLRQTGQLVGAIGVVYTNENAGSAHIGYCIGRSWWHQGVTSEAFAAVIDFLFNEVGLNRIDSRHDPRNVYSGRVMQKCGLRYEGTMRQADRNNQGLCDAAWYGLLRQDYIVG